MFNFKKIFWVVFLFFISQCAFAIDWVELKTPLNRQVFIDKDSISLIKNHYFYNIKFTNPNSEKYVIITMQSAFNKSYSARTKSYELDEYDRLNGDYANIASNYTDKLEPVTYNSVVYTCYKFIKQQANIYNTSFVTVE